MANRLTNRQSEVRDLIGFGLSNKEIGEQLGISFRTVEDHRAAIYRHYGVRNAVQLMRKLLLAVPA